MKTRNEARRPCRIPIPRLTEARGDRDTTIKWLWRAAGDVAIETVLMVSPARATVCVSSQAGCAMGCTFCATVRALNNAPC